MQTESEHALTREIGERLRYARHSKGLSLGQISALTGGALSKSRIGNYELGIRGMSVEAARLLADALGTCTPAFLLCVEDHLNLTADEIDLIQTYRATDAKGQALVRKKANGEAQRVAQEGGLRGGLGLRG
jgi:transcriptional regulator with XRE-family HTH domain